MWKYEAADSISLHFHWMCCCLMLLSVGAILRTSLLKAVTALSIKSNIANLAAVSVDLDLQRLTLGS